MALKDFLPKMTKKPTKEDLVEIKRQQALVTQVIWPILLKHAKSVKDAKTILNTIVVGLDAVYMLDAKKYNEKRSAEALETLDLTASMNKSKQYTAEWELVEALRDETISATKALLSGMDKEVQRLIDKELIERPLDSLKTEFL